jgi:sulfate/thiosulfate transport system permease protein
VPDARANERTALNGRRAALLALVVLYLGVLAIAPLAAIVHQFFAGGPGKALGELISSGALGAFGRTLAVMAIAIAVNAVFGVAAALVLARQKFLGRGLLDGLVEMPLAVSPVMTGLAFILIFGANGWARALVEPLGVKVIFSFLGLVIGTVFVTMPFVVREVVNVLGELGTSEEDAAATLGASRWQTFRFVTFRNIRHGLSFGVTLTAARALGEFGAVVVLGGAISGQTDTATTFIYNAVEERHDGAAAGMSLALALASALVLVALERLKRRARKEI